MARAPATTAATLAEVARAAEEAGFTSLWVMDHFLQIPQVGREWEDMLESYTTLGYLAGVTERIRLGTLVTGITYRNLAHLAKIVATLDVVSGGRALCGLGPPGSSASTGSTAGTFPPLRRALRAARGRARAAAADVGAGLAALRGPHAHLAEATCYPRPLQERIPILVGGSGERRTLRLVARHADACNLFGDPATVRHKLAVLQAHCAAEGATPRRSRSRTSPRRASSRRRAARGAGRGDRRGARRPLPRARRGRRADGDRRRCPTPRPESVTPVRRRDRGVRVRASRGLRGALAAAQVVYGRLPPRRLVGATRGIVGLMLAASSAEAIEARGVRRGGGAVAAAGALGFAAELAGVATGRPFGHYTYSGQLGPRVGGVPLLAAAAWAMMARPSWVVAGLISRRRAPRIALAAGALTAWDVFLDPRMAREGYWSWPGGGRYEGVPASNFLGWFVTGAGVFAVWSLLDGDDEPLVDGDGALALYAWTWVGETFANAVLWRRPVVAAAGFAAMGAFAAPALAARLRAMSRVVVIGAGVGGLAAAIRLAHAGHAVTVLEQAAMPGGKCGHVRARRLLLGLGAVAADDAVGVRGAVRRHRRAAARRARAAAGRAGHALPFADGSGFDLSADLPRSVAALEAWSPGAGADWERFLATCAGMWHASLPVPDRPAAVAAAPRRGRRRPGDLLRVKPWWTLRQLARAHARDPRLRMVIERFATYAGADPRRAPAALAVAGYVEHAFGAWHPRGGLYGLVEAMARRLDALGGELRLGTPVRRVIRRDGAARGVETAARARCRRRRRDRERRPAAAGRSGRGSRALAVGLRADARAAGADRGARAPRDHVPAPTTTQSSTTSSSRGGRSASRPVRERASATDPGEAPAGAESWFVLVNAPAVGDAPTGTAYEEALDRPPRRARSHRRPHPPHPG